MGYVSTALEDGLCLNCRLNDYVLLPGATPRATPRAPGAGVMYSGARPSTPVGTPTAAESAFLPNISYFTTRTGQNLYLPPGWSSKLGQGTEEPADEKTFHRYVKGYTPPAQDN